ncbi:MAG: amino acid adenylation domain-containing protein [Leptolyngbya sp. SIOISBB]|nr:amino acid adenylation domain-containing protein [Leptolyngbya sp. SIOISBB]
MKSMKYDINLTVETLFEQQVQLSPQAPAVSFQGESLSYQELDSRANQLANYLQDQGVTVNSLVGICLDRSINLIVSVLAIFKAGAAYLPLDQAYPADRLRLMIEDSAVSLIITQKHLDEALPSTGAKPIFLDCEAARIAHSPDSQPPKQTTPDSLAYVIYTSGSTGKPKGVTMPHRPLVNLLSWQQQQFQNPQARTLQFTPISFDVSFQEIFSTLSSGGTLILIGDMDRRNSETLLAHLCENSVERLFLPFIALQNLAEAATTTQHLPVTLQEIITAGEQLKITRSMVSLFDRLKDCSLVNQYGPSESHVVTQHVLTGSPSDWPHLPPIGKPIDNTQLYLLKTPSRREDDPIALAEPGEPGELAIGGICLANGYLNQPELTHRRFIKNPFTDEPAAILYKTGDLVKRSKTGELEYIERLDDQVKVRGVRVELGEVEARVSQHAMVKANAISARKRVDGATYLAAYIVPNRPQYLQNSVELERQLRTFLKEHLPAYMMPTFFEFLPTLPLTPSGKVDRRALPEPHQERPVLGQNYLQPRTDIEQKLAELWSEVLEFKKIGVKDNFFEFGGDSLRAVQLVHMVCETFKIELPIVTLFDAPTIEALGNQIQRMINSGKTVTSDDISPTELERQAIPNIGGDLTTQPWGFSEQPTKVLITGVTGFLGAFLLGELLKQTSADIYCLVRATSDEVGKQKLRIT